MKQVLEVEVDEESAPLLRNQRSYGDDSQFFEKDPVGIRPGIAINGLRKVNG